MRLWLFPPHSSSLCETNWICVQQVFVAYEWVLWAMVSGDSCSDWNYIIEWGKGCYSSLSDFIWHLATYCIIPSRNMFCMSTVHTYMIICGDTRLVCVLMQYSPFISQHVEVSQQSSLTYIIYNGGRKHMCIVGGSSPLCIYMQDAPCWVTDYLQLQLLSNEYLIWYFWVCTLHMGEPFQLIHICLMWWHNTWVLMLWNPFRFT